MNAFIKKTISKCVYVYIRLRLHVLYKHGLQFECQTGTLKTTLNGGIIYLRHKIRLDNPRRPTKLPPLFIYTVI